MQSNTNRSANAGETGRLEGSCKLIFFSVPPCLCFLEMYDQTRADLKSIYFSRKLVIYSFPTEHKYHTHAPQYHHKAK